MYKKILLVLYKVTASWLPISQRSKLSKKARTFWAKRIATRVGKNVNIERKAVFGPLLEIGDNSGVGINCEVYGPVNIGDGCVIGAGAVVTKDIPPYSVAGGVPAKVIKSRKSNMDAEIQDEQF